MARRDTIGWAGKAMAAAAPKRLGGLLAALAGLFLALAVPASAQQIPNMGSPMVPNAAANGGSFPPAACVTANGVIFNNAVPCDLGLTYGGLAAGAPLAIAQGTITTNIKALSITATWNAVGTTFDAPLFMNITNTASAAGSLLADFQVGGSSIFKIGTVGNVIVGNNGYFQGSLFYAASNTGYFSAGNSQDVYLTRDTAGIFGLSNGASDNGTVTLPASLRVYNVASTTLANYERIEVGFAAHSNIAAIDVSAAGTGVVRGFGLYVGGSLYFDYNVTNSGFLSFSTAAIRVSNAVEITGSYYMSSNGTSWSLGSKLSSTADGVLALSNFGSTITTFLTVPANANLQFGANNVNGAPVAQTISFQGALAGSATNQASANTTVIGSLGTGTGTNGDLIFQTGVKTTTGTAQATATTALTIKGETGQLFLGPDGSAANPIIRFPDGSGFYRNASNTGWSHTGSANFAFDGNNGIEFVAAGWGIGYSTGGISSNADLSHYRDAAGVLAITATNVGSVTASPAGLRVYNTSSTAFANYERGVIDWTTTANVLTIGTQFLGTGVARNIQVAVGSNVNLEIGASDINMFGVVSGTSALRFSSNAGAGLIQFNNNNQNIGATAGGNINIVTGGAVAVTGTMTISALVNSATTSAVCYNTGTGALTYDGTIGTCTVSGRQFKNILGGMNVASLSPLRPTVYRYKPESGFDDGRTHVGLLAQDVAQMDDRCAVRNADNDIINYEDRCVLAHLVADNDNLRAEFNAYRRAHP